MPIDSILTKERLGIPSVKESVAIRHAITKQKYEQALPQAMRNHGIDLWLILDREFNPDPMLVDLGGDSGGVRTAHMFFDRGAGSIERVAINSHGFRETIIPDLFDEVIFYGYDPAGLAPHLKAAIEKRNPGRIAINCSPTLPMADGLTYELRRYLEQALAPEYRERLVSAELVARDYRTTRVPAEIELYRRLCGWTATWLETALSEQVIQPGVTTPEDIYWWMRQVAGDLGLGPSLLPGVRLSRRGYNYEQNTGKERVQPGDYIHIDAGLGFLNYHNDMKRAAYIRHEGETAPPTVLRNAYAETVRMRNLITSQMKPGAIGTQVWQACADLAAARGYEILHPTGGRMRAEGNEPGFGNYTHSIGNSIHGIGARVAEDWPMAFGDRVRYAMGLGHWYSIELHVATPVPEWEGRTVESHIEEQGRVVGNGQVEYFVPPQEQWLLIPRIR
ncbi:MAG: aminopeptidase P family protein [Chloroflexi bacterium]|nr:aminopeptidase P family protein [Chloroflexota bacterium]